MNEMKINWRYPVKTKKWIIYCLLGLMTLYALIYTCVNFIYPNYISQQEYGKVAANNTYDLHRELEIINKVRQDNGIKFKPRVDYIIDRTEFWLNYTNFSTMVREESSGRDARVVHLVQSMMDPPSTNMLKRSNNLITTPQTKLLLSLTKYMKSGFFIECGALDGERSSNTVTLEADHEWYGLLIEMDPFFYTQLLGKNRKSWSINACLSPEKHVSYLNYSESHSGLGQLIYQGIGEGETKVTRTVPCFPFESFLLALNRTKVDFFSLDVEGMELKVLETIPFNKIDISVITVEHLHVLGGKDRLRKYMESQGYVMYKQIDYTDQKITLYAHDFFFVKKTYLESL